MSAFERGFAIGGDIASQAQKLKIAEEAAAREKERFTWEQKTRAGEEGLRTAAMNIANMGDTMQTVVPGSIDSKDMPEGQMGPYAESQTVPMSAEQKDALFKKEALSAGANPLNVMAYQKGAMEIEKGGIELKNAKREAKLADAFDAENLSYRDTLTKIFSTAETGGMKGLSEAANEEGLKTKFVAGKNGMGTIQVLGPKGDVIKTFNDVKSATEALVGAAQTRFTQKLETMFGSAEKAANYYSKREEIKIQQRNSETQQEYYGKGGVAERVGMAKVAASYNRSPGGGGTNSAENQDRIISSQAEILMKGQPNRFKNIDVAKAWIVNAKLKGEDTAKQWNTIETDLYKQGREAEIGSLKNKFFADRGFAPQSVLDAAASGINPVTKKPFTEAEQNDFARRYPNSYVEFGTPAAPAPPNAAIPVEKEKPKTQVKINFGPKVPTAEEKAEYDAKKKEKAEGVAKEKEAKQALRVEKSEKAAEAKANAAKESKNKQIESDKIQLKRAEAKRDAALAKGDSAAVKINERNIAILKKRLEDNK
jgi:hypothetical protein